MNPSDLMNNNFGYGHFLCLQSLLFLSYNLFLNKILLVLSGAQKVLFLSQNFLFLENCLESFFLLVKFRSGWECRTRTHPHTSYQKRPFASDPFSFYTLNHIFYFYPRELFCHLIFNFLFTVFILYSYFRFSCTCHQFNTPKNSLNKSKLILFFVLPQPSIIDLTKQLQCLLGQTMRLFGEYLSLNFQATLFKEDYGTQLSYEFCENFKYSYSVKHLKMPASLQYHANINLEKSLHELNLFLI